MHIFDFNPFYKQLTQSPFSNWLEYLPAQLATWQMQEQGDRFDNWLKIVDELPQLSPDLLDLKSQVFANLSMPLSYGESKRIFHLLAQLSPWRKGPFSLYDIEIDAEWRSDLKWNRVIKAISPLEDRYVLDVGCNSGYYLWRMLGEKVKMAIGIDPMPLFFMQFQAVKKLLGSPEAVHFAPIGIEMLPELNAFDTVFSMGVLYHRKSPFDHLLQLKQQLREGGELILETLVINGDDQQVLVPQDRYAKMRNIYFIPSVNAMESWLKKAGFKNIHLIDCTYTDPVNEQRKTAWINTESLSDFLDPTDPSKTIEGYSAPLRAVFIANK